MTDYRSSGDLVVRYVERWFESETALARRCGVSLGKLRDLIEAQASPGVVYSLSPSGEWWSALAGFTGKAPPHPPAGGENWYSPAAAYWLRRAVLCQRQGLSLAQAAAANRAAFVVQFIDALAAEPLAVRNYPDAFANGEVHAEAAEGIANSEWDAWLSGAYAVCLKTFTGESCVAKESLARFLREQAEAPSGDQIEMETLDAMERLSTWLLPFSPFERASGTPGLAIDRNLERMRLGVEDPFAADFELAEIPLRSH